MSQIGNQRWDTRLNVVAGPMPVDQSANRESMAQIVHPRRHFATTQPQTGDEFPERDIHRAGFQRGAGIRNKKVFDRDRGCTPSRC